MDCEAQKPYQKMSLGAKQSRSSPQIASVAAPLRSDRWVEEWRMEEWKDGRLDSGSVLGRQVQHDLEVEDPEIRDRRQRDVRRGSTRLTVDDGPLTMDNLPRPEIGLQKKADHRPHETSNGITMDGTLC
jgi:hypothetical protein